jgi:hypothetical protein
VASRSLLIAAVAIATGVSVAFFNMFRWAEVQNVVATAGKSSVQLVLDFYLAQALSTVLVVIGLYQFYRAVVSARPVASPSTLSVMRDAFASRRAVRLGAAVAVVYAVAYAFVSSIVVYQPGVDFATVYGVSGPSWSVFIEGATGATPAIYVYLPSQHLGMQLLPLTLLFIFLVPVLVGFNVVLSFYALRLSSFPQSGRWLATSGALFGLFTACPTCAGLFLASSIGGVGTTLALALAPFQLLFVAITLPVLLLGPLFTAMSVKKSYEASCRLPLSRATAKIQDG